MSQSMDYFEQWQYLSVAAKDWQNDPSEQQHPGRAKVAELVKAAGNSVLEVACGIGIDYPRYKELGVNYMGVDITPRFIEEAQRRGVPAQVADGRNLPFPDNSFDTVYAKDLFIHLPPNVWRQVLKEMARVARKQVLILDDAWYGRTLYLLREKYHALVKGKVQELLFYNNLYAEDDFHKEAESLGLTVEVTQGGNVKRIEVSPDGTKGVLHPSQITIYHKKEQ